MNVKRNLLNIAVLSTLALGAGSASAVYLSEDGTGEVLYYPYYTVQDGNVTAVSVVNTTGETKAVKVRFREAKNSREVLDFNLYLSPYDVWTGAISATASGAMLTTTDKSCTVPAIPAAGIEFRNYQYITSGSAQNADGEDTSLARTREGYLEVIEMGVVSPTFDLDSSSNTLLFTSAVKHTGGVPANCAAVNAAFLGSGSGYLGVPLPSAGDTTAPSGGIAGSGTIINVGNGTDFTYDPVALDHWEDTSSQHAGIGNEQPTITAGDPTSTVFFGGNVIQSLWVNNGTDATPRADYAADPVSSVLMRTAVINEYTVESALAAGTDWVVTFPTKKFYVSPDTDTDADTVDLNFSRPFSQDFKLNGACEVVALSIHDREEATREGTLDFSPLPPGQSDSSLCWEVNVVTIANTNVLGSAIALNVPSDYQNGWMRIGFNDANASSAAPTNSLDGDLDGTGVDIQETTRQMESFDADNGTAPVEVGDVYHGLPVIGFAVQEYVNGSVGGVLSNYGGNFAHKYERNISSNGLTN